MTREEAKAYFKRHIDLYCVTGICREAEEMAIQALEQEPCEDAISRAKAMTEIMMNTNIREHLDGNLYIKVADAVQILRDLPSVKPQEKTGHWKYDYTSADGHKTYHCSKCGCYLQPKYSEPLSSFKWCSLCGARMEVEQNG